MIDRLARMAICATTMLCGCQVQNTTVVDQTTATGPASRHVVLHIAAPSPCTAPAHTGPFERLTRPQTASAVPMPRRALAERVNGCAGVRFRIGPDGSPRDIAVLTEYPLGYGFADTSRAAIAATRWPPGDDMAWRYLIINMHPGTPKPS